MNELHTRTHIESKAKDKVSPEIKQGNDCTKKFTRTDFVSKVEFWQQTSINDVLEYILTDVGRLNSMER